MRAGNVRFRDSEHQSHGNGCVSNPRMMTINNTPKATPKRTLVTASTDGVTPSRLNAQLKPLPRRYSRPIYAQKAANSVTVA